MAIINFVRSRLLHLNKRVGIDKTVLNNLVDSTANDSMTSNDTLLDIASKLDSMRIHDYNYGRLAAVIMVNIVQKQAGASFADAMNNIDRAIGMINRDKLAFINAHRQELDAMIDHERDYVLEYNGIASLRSGYLIKNSQTKEVYETPQYMYMRVAIEVSDRAIESIRDTYNALSLQKYIHATPTLFNSCTINNQSCSCFLTPEPEDSIDGILDLYVQCCNISKNSGGIGVPFSSIRGSGARIKSSNGVSRGIIPQIKQFDAGASCWDQGGDKRKGAWAMYLADWHCDIISFLQLKLPTGAAQLRATNLNYAVFMSNLFYKRWQQGHGTAWSLFSPDTAPGLTEVYGDEFEKLYERYESEGRAVATITVGEIIDAISYSLRQCGQPYVCNKDNINNVSNQKNLGVVKSSNLCAEIVEVATKDSFASCTLGSVILRNYVVKGPDGEYVFDYADLYKQVKIAVRALNKVIDNNEFPLGEICKQNARDYRPIGIGMQGLADVFMIMRVPYLSDKARTIDKLIAETMYHAALEASCEEAQKYGPYVGFDGSPLSKGEFHFENWIKNVEKIRDQRADCSAKAVDTAIFKPSAMYDWDGLRAKIIKHGVRNSLLLALMPTVGTAAIAASTCSFEPINCNLYSHNTLYGFFTIVNKYLYSHLSELGLWTPAVIEKIIENNGDIGSIEEIPASVREVYLSVFDLPQMRLMERAAIRGAYIDQSMSLNIYRKVVDNKFVRTIMMYGYELGLKTSIYYLHSRPERSAKGIKISSSPVDAVASESGDDAGDAVCTSCVG